ncbi:hypothetical protein ACC685_38510, partial [Rhizobium ruizarguesonis]
MSSHRAPGSGRDHRRAISGSRARDRQVIETDIRKWDYKNQVLKMRYLNPIVLVACVKLIEVAVQARP